MEISLIRMTVLKSRNLGFGQKKLRTNRGVPLDFLQNACIFVNMSEHKTQPHNKLFEINFAGRKLLFKRVAIEKLRPNGKILKFTFLG